MLCLMLIEQYGKMNTQMFPTHSTYYTCGCFEVSHTGQFRKSMPKAVNYWNCIVVRFCQLGPMKAIGERCLCAAAICTLLYYIYPCYRFNYMVFLKHSWFSIKLFLLLSYFPHWYIFKQLACFFFFYAF